MEICAQQKRYPMAQRRVNIRESDLWRVLAMHKFQENDVKSVPSVCLNIAILAWNLLERVLLCLVRHTHTHTHTPINNELHTIVSSVSVPPGNVRSLMWLSRSAHLAFMILNSFFCSLLFVTLVANEIYDKFFCMHTNRKRLFLCNYKNAVGIFNPASQQKNPHTFYHTV